MLYLLARKPRDLRLRAVTVLVGSWALAYPFGVAATLGTAFVGIEPMVSRLVQHALLLVGAYCLISFFLFSVLDVQHARTRARWHALVLTVAIAVMTVATAVMPGDIRTAAAVLPAENTQGPVGVASIGLFYLTANSYLLYAFVTAQVLTRRYARVAEPRLRRGLRLASVGLVAIVFANATFVAANAIRWAGGTTPRPILVAGMILLLPGILLFLVGVSYPAAIMRVAALRVWWQHRCTYRQLGPLWTLLHAEFPEDALSRVPVRPLSDFISLRGVHRRYYRRAIECRDGLVQISPHVAQLQQNGRQGEALAALLKEAVLAHAAGEPVSRRATLVAAPSEAGLDADVHELVALSQALHTT
ncbi:hypothetical protein F0L68_39300 [Solihabitans fulvus]|uniref:DUF6545 domain-containing protein n=2 Tax=Solihabitans fulvus TaxID=1892852 RepID=A0A5B2WER3_9PSEU|nr:hypothetical protein F0L68_39300 [Solihabitans fulvus]